MKTKNQNTIITLDNGFELIACPLRDLKNGEWFTFKPIESPAENQVYIKRCYIREDKTFSCECFADMNKERFIKSNKIVYTGFIF